MKHRMSLINVVGDMFNRYLLAITGVQGLMCAPLSMRRLASAQPCRLSLVHMFLLKAMGHRRGHYHIDRQMAVHTQTIIWTWANTIIISPCECHQSVGRTSCHRYPRGFLHAPRDLRYQWDELMSASNTLLLIEDPIMDLVQLTGLRMVLEA